MSWLRENPGGQAKPKLLAEAGVGGGNCGHVWGLPADPLTLGPWLEAFASPHHLSAVQVDDDSIAGTRRAPSPPPHSSLLLTNTPGPSCAAERLAGQDSS